MIFYILYSRKYCKHYCRMLSKMSHYWTGLMNTLVMTMLDSTHWNMFMHFVRAAINRYVMFIIPPENKKAKIYRNQPVCLSDCPSFRLAQLKGILYWWNYKVVRYDMCTKEDTPGSKISTVISFAYVILMDNSVNALCSRVLSRLGRYFKLE